LRKPWPQTVELGCHRKDFAGSVKGQERVHQLEKGLLRRWENVISPDPNRVRVATSPDISEEDRLVLGDGFKRIVEHVATGLDVRYCQRALGVSYRGSKVIVEVETQCAVKAYNCDLCLVTVPVGVLRGLSPKSAIAFDPPMPQKKAAAIQRIAVPKAGTPTHEKVFLRFKTKDIFWDTTVAHLASPDPRFLFSNLHRVGKTGVLLAHIWAESNFDISSMSDQAVVKEVMSGLRQWMVWRAAVGVECDPVPWPCQYLVTRWGTDPFTLGSYSAPELNSVAGDYAALAAPLRRPWPTNNEATKADDGPVGTWFFNKDRSCYTISAINCGIQQSGDGDAAGGGAGPEGGVETPQFHFEQRLANNAMLSGDLVRCSPAAVAEGVEAGVASGWMWEAMLSNRARIRLAWDGASKMFSSYRPRTSEAWARPRGANRRAAEDAVKPAVVFFAGEACSKALRQTAGGAFISGAETALTMKNSLRQRGLHKDASHEETPDSEILDDLTAFLWPKESGGSASALTHRSGRS